MLNPHVNWPIDLHPIASTNPTVRILSFHFPSQRIHIRGASCPTASPTIIPWSYPYLTFHRLSNPPHRLSRHRLFFSFVVPRLLPKSIIRSRPLPASLYPSLPHASNTYPLTRTRHSSYSSCPQPLHLFYPSPIPDPFQSPVVPSTNSHPDLRLWPLPNEWHMQILHPTPFTPFLKFSNSVNKQTPNQENGKMTAK